MSSRTSNYLPGVVVELLKFFYLFGIHTHQSTIQLDNQVGVEKKNQLRTIDLTTLARPSVKVARSQVQFFHYISWLNITMKLLRSIYLSIDLQLGAPPSDQNRCTFFYSLKQNNKANTHAYKHKIEIIGLDYNLRHICRRYIYKGDHYVIKKWEDVHF